MYKSMITVLLCLSLRLFAISSSAAANYYSNDNLNVPLQASASGAPAGLIIGDQEHIGVPTANRVNFYRMRYGRPSVESPYTTEVPSGYQITRLQAMQGRARAIASLMETSQGGSPGPLYSQWLIAYENYLKAEANASLTQVSNDNATLSSIAAIEDSAFVAYRNEADSLAYITRTTDADPDKFLTPVAISQAPITSLSMDIGIDEILSVGFTDTNSQATVLKIETRNNSLAVSGSVQWSDAKDSIYIKTGTCGETVATCRDINNNPTVVSIYDEVIQDRVSLASSGAASDAMGSGYNGRGAGFVSYAQATQPIYGTAFRIKSNKTIEISNEQLVNSAPEVGGVAVYVNKDGGVLVGHLDSSNISNVLFGSADVDFQVIGQGTSPADPGLAPYAFFIDPLGKGINPTVSNDQGTLLRAVTTTYNKTDKVAEFTKILSPIR